jgi:glycosyltransferase involved in cell wall biosynthesis
MVPVNQSEYEFMNEHKRKRAGIMTIPHGIEIDLFKPLPKEPREEIVVGYVGRLAPIKYPEEVLKIFKEASKGIEKTEFVWIGQLDNSFDKDYFGTLKERMGIENAKHLGKIDNKNLPEYLNKIDIFLSAEQQKNVSKSTTEAAACGLPIVAYNIGSEPYGFFSMDRNEVIEELRKLLAWDKYRTAKGTIARKVIEKDYSEDIIYNKYLGVFGSLK